MELRHYIQNKLFEREPIKYEYEFQALGVELQPIYGKAIWSLFYKPGNTEDKIRRAHKIAQERGVLTLPFLIGVLKRL